MGQSITKVILIHVLATISHFISITTEHFFDLKSPIIMSILVALKYVCGLKR